MIDYSLPESFSPDEAEDIVSPIRWFIFISFDSHLAILSVFLAIFISDYLFL